MLTARGYQKWVDYYFYHLHKAMIEHDLPTMLWAARRLRLMRECQVEAAQKETEPHWERGYRVHGYWLGLVRVGHVSRLFKTQATDAHRYAWEVAPPGSGNGSYHDKDAYARGKCKTLKQAKRLVEKHYREAVSCRKSTTTPSTASTARARRSTCSSTGTSGTAPTTSERA